MQTMRFKWKVECSIHSHWVNCRNAR